MLTVKQMNTVYILVFVVMLTVALVVFAAFMSFVVR